MSTRLDGRIAKLEAKQPKEMGAWGCVSVWPGQSQEEAVALAYGDNPPPNMICRIIVESPHDRAAQ